MSRLLAVAGFLVVPLILEGDALLYLSPFLQPSHHRSAIPRVQRNNLHTGARSWHCNATSSLIEATACRVLKLVLRNGRQAHVSCSVQSEPLEILQGRLKSASVNGRDWASRLGFTARMIAVDVGHINLDIGAILRRHVLEFHTPHPSGRAVVAFDARDFGNFLMHRLVHQAHLSGRRFLFSGANVSIDPDARVIRFDGKWGDYDVQVELSQPNPNAQLVAKVTRENGEDILGEAELVALGEDISDYFNTLEIDLDGPTLRFQKLSFEGCGATGATFRLHLSFVVRKLPSVRSMALF